MPIAVESVPQDRRSPAYYVARSPDKTPDKAMAIAGDTACMWRDRCEETIAVGKE